MAQLFTKRLDALVRAVLTRHGRKKYGLCLCEGVRCCRDLVDLKPEIIQYAFCSESFDQCDFDLDFVVLPDAKFQQLTPTKDSQGIFLLAKIPDDNDDVKAISDPFVVILDQVQDPGNFGTICRTVRAIGLTELWVTKGSVDPYNDKVIRSSLASQFALTIRRFNTLSDIARCLKTFAYNTIYRTDPHRGISCYSEEFKLQQSAVILGSEAHGVSELSDSLPVTINMPGGVESLNVAQAATIILFEYVRRSQ